MNHYIVSLDSKLALQETYAGGKGASLAQLRKQGFNVPQGFVITSTTFREFLADFGIEVLTQRMDWIESDLERIGELLLACRIPDHLMSPIIKSYQKLGGPVAVRSSMVGEDTDVASFAGQLDTILNVQGEKELTRAVKRCWASLFNWRLFSYLTQRETVSPETLLESFSIAVVVQRMVDAQAAGVAFSADPVTGQPYIVIEAVRGLGDALVQGLVEPDRYVVDSRGVLVETTLADAKVPVLEETQVLPLADIVRDIAGRMKTPQDVEWAWDGTNFHLLQSRPITSLVGQRVYSNRIMSEQVPGLVKPLVWSTNTDAMMRNVFGQVFTELIGPNDVDFTLIAKRIHSRIYADSTMLGELLERVGLPANFFEMMSRDDKADRRRLPMNLKMLRAVFRLFGFAWRHSRIVDDVSAFVEQHDRELEPHRRADCASMESQDLLARVDQLMHLFGESFWYNFVVPINMQVRNALLNRLAKQWAPDVVSSDLIRGLVGLKALEPNDGLRDLAAQAATLGDEIQRLLIEENDEAIREALLASEKCRALVHNVDAFLDQYGFLSTNGTDFSRTAWVENATLIWRAVGRTAAQPAEPITEDVEAIREEARQRVLANLNWAQRVLFNRLLASTIAYIDLRERTSLLLSEDSYQMRRTFLALADHFVARGDLDQCDDIFYLALEEIRQLVDGTLTAQTAREWVVSRRAEMEADALLELPDTIYGDYVPTQPITPAEGQECLFGISGSSGRTQGYARIVLDPSEAPTTLTQDDILVVPFTDVGWTPLFSGIGGIVAETGGQLSHSSIVAREYGLPAVVNVKKVTHLVKEGQPITVDGDNGRVYLSHVGN